ncbi:hypothetical protein DPMN_148973 [Dreissena polymorpha]|uniref:Uncharacterized protein n=1 Tax=Dreissena polymorpha TaxID=45954 RepID=A0A9D4J4I7_DREPO|nr:hypothetical protein DPMN_148973 [Dreissena polymorpha]
MPSFIFFLTSWFAFWNSVLDSWLVYCPCLSFLLLSQRSIILAVSHGWLFPKNFFGQWQQDVFDVVGAYVIVYDVRGCKLTTWSCQPPSFRFARQ